MCHELLWTVDLSNSAYCYLKKKKKEKRSVLCFVGSIIILLNNLICLLKKTHACFSIVMLFALELLPVLT